MARVLVAIRFPEELKRFVDEESAKRGMTSTAFIVNACWCYLEESTTLPKGPAVTATIIDEFGELGKPDMDALHAICTGKVAVVHPIPVEPERPMCAYTEYDEPTGETMACGLHQHSAKVRHGNWKRA